MRFLSGLLKEQKRLQVFEGDVIAMHKKVLQVHLLYVRLCKQCRSRTYLSVSPVIDGIKVVRKGDVRRAKLYYLRDRVGKAAQVKKKYSKEAREHARERAREVQKTAKGKSTS